MPTGGDTPDGKPSPPGSVTRAAFRQEPDCLVLSNPLLSIAFSASHGALVSLLNRPTQVDLIDGAEAASEGAFWRCQIASADGSQITLTSRDCREFSHVIENSSNGALRLRLLWTGLQVGAESVAGQAAATLELPADSHSVSLNLELQLPDHLSVASIDFPCVSSLGSAEPLGEESLFLPLSGGTLVHEPRAWLALRGEGPAWQATYPGRPPCSSWASRPGIAPPPGWAPWMDRERGSPSPLASPPARIACLCGSRTTPCARPMATGPPAAPPSLASSLATGSRPRAGVPELGDPSVLVRPGQGRRARSAGTYLLLRPVALPLGRRQGRRRRHPRASARGERSHQTRLALLAPLPLRRRLPRLLPAS